MKWTPFIIFFFFISCQFSSNKKKQIQGDVFESEFTTNIENAKGFEIIESDSFFTLRIKSLSVNYPFSDSLVFPKDNIDLNAKLWQPNWQKLACQSTTHLTFLNALGAFKKVVGLSDIKFMPKDAIFDKVKQAGILELSSNNAIDLERLISLKPDVFFMYPFEWESQKYKQASINTLLIAEYLEQTPIARLEWIKVFGLIIGKEAEADSVFKVTKNRYENLRQSNPIDKTVFFNLPFKEVWDMPAPQSITVNLIKDAGLNYVFDSKIKSVDNISLVKERVWSKVYNADYWIIIAGRPEDFSLNNLVKEEPVYKTFKSFKQKQVIFCNTNQSSYFTEGILEPEIMLKDLLFLTGQIDNHQPKYFHLLK